MGSDLAVSYSLFPGTEQAENAEELSALCCTLRRDLQCCLGVPVHWEQGEDS